MKDNDKVYIKSFGDRHLETLDEKVNIYINSNDITIIDIKISSASLSTANSAAMWFTYVIMYKKNYK